MSNQLEDLPRASHKIALEGHVALIPRYRARKHRSHAAMMTSQRDHRIGEDMPKEEPAIEARESARGALQIAAKRLAPALVVDRVRASIDIATRAGNKDSRCELSPRAVRLRQDLPPLKR